MSLSHPKMLPYVSSQFQRFATLVAASLLIAVGPGRHLLAFAYRTDDQSYILLVPLITAVLIYRERDQVFANEDGHARLSVAAILLGLAGIIPVASAYFLVDGSEAQMAVTAIGLIFCWIAAFVDCFGSSSARKALFPLGMLFWIVPIPSAIINEAILFLQARSADTVSLMFQATGLPMLREGFVFHLAAQSIEVAKECSGIRSSLCLMLLTFIIAHESLQGNVRRGVLLLSTIPIVILKNGVRIVTLTLLAIYVDPSFLTGHLHHDGGIVFFLIGMVMLLPIIAILRHGDGAPTSRAKSSSATVGA